MRRILLLASLIALTTARPASAALVNGSFEPDAGAPAPARAKTTNAIPGWLASGELGWQDAQACGFVAPAGSRVVEFGAHVSKPGRLRQSFATTPGERYDLLFWLGSHADARGRGRAMVRVEVAGKAHTLAIDNRSADVLWQAHVLTFTAEGPVTALALRGVHRRNAAAAYVDGVVVRPAAAGGVIVRPAGTEAASVIGSR